MLSVDGRIDCAMTEKIDSSDVYYEALDRLQFDAVLRAVSAVRCTMHCPSLLWLPIKHL